MNRFWLVAAYEYRRNVFKKSFLIVMLSVPLLLALMFSIGYFIDRAQTIDLPIGYVDQAGLLTVRSAAPALYSQWIEGQADAVDFIAYADEDLARLALQEGAIQAYFVMPADYLETRTLDLVYIEDPGDNAVRLIYHFLQINLLAGQPVDTSLRVAGGSIVIVRSLNGSREVPSNGPTLGMLLPLFLTIAFLVLLVMSSGYALGAVTDEKENRTMEVLVTSVSPLQLIGGKIVGILGISLTMLGSWLLELVLGVWIARAAGSAWFADLRIDWGSILTALAIAVPGYILAVALMTAVGAVVPSNQDGQSISSVFFILHFIPLYISWMFLQEPHGPLAVTLSLLPFTALITVGMRNLVTIVPLWQVAVSAAVQMLCAAGAIWVAGKVFRLGMLRYGQRLSLRGLLRRQAGR